jgi:putative DNA primase/helicase
MKNLHSDAREQREPREHTSNVGARNRSHHTLTIGNNENKLITAIENPIDTIPKILITPIIKRPCYLSHADWFELDGKKMKPGLYCHYEVTKNGEVISIDEWVSSPLNVKAITSSARGDDFGRLLHFIDSHGKWHEWAMPMYLLKGSGEELRGELLNQGLIFNTAKHGRILEFIMTERPTQRIIAASKVGWHENTFILPNQVIGKDDVVFQSEVAGENDFLAVGSFEGWTQTIGKYCLGNIPLLVSVSAALSGPLLKLVNRQQGGGIHWVGDSSIGKSTAIEIGASVWGPPEFIRSWSGTANGLEGTAATRNDTCLILDEINEASPHEIGKIVYMLINGQGKQRAGRIGNARKIQRWRLMAVSTGEKTLENIMNEAGKQANTGQLVRLLNIPATFKYGVFDNLHGFEDGRSLADSLKTACLKNYGYLGPEFVRCLVQDKRDFTSILDQLTKKISASVSTNLEKRAAAIFAIIGMAGELAIEYGLLHWDKNTALYQSPLKIRNCVH